MTEYFVIKILIKQNWTHGINSPPALDMSRCIGSYIRYICCCNVVPWTYTCTIRWVRVWSLKRWHLFQPRHSVEEESSSKIHWQIMAKHVSSLTQKELTQLTLKSAPFTTTTSLHSPPVFGLYMYLSFTCFC